MHFYFVPLPVARYFPLGLGNPILVIAGMLKVRCFRRSWAERIVFHHPVRFFIETAPLCDMSKKKTLSVRMLSSEKSLRSVRSGNIP